MESRIYSRYEFESFPDRFDKCVHTCPEKNRFLSKNEKDIFATFLYIYIYSICLFIYFVVPLAAAAAAAAAH